MGNCSGRTVDKFIKFGLTSVPAAEVAAPLIGAVASETVKLRSAMK